MEEKTLTVAEAARALGCEQNTIYRLCRATGGRPAHLAPIIAPPPYADRLRLRDCAELRTLYASRPKHTGRPPKNGGSTPTRAAVALDRHESRQNGAQKARNKVDRLLRNSLDSM